MYDELLPLEEREKEIPRWLQIPIGLALGLLTLALGLASAALLFAQNAKAPSPALAVVAVLILLLACFWVLEKCFRLVTGRKNRGGLMSPTTLRVLSIFFLVLPVGGIFTGYYRQMGSVAMFQAVMYFFAFLRLRRLARRREVTARERLSSDNHNRRS
jgi:membrane associated rhomboid family serine protease